MDTPHGPEDGRKPSRVRRSIGPLLPAFSPDYSCRIASTTESRAARNAGYSPAAMPTMAVTTMLIVATRHDITHINGTLITWRINEVTTQEKQNPTHKPAILPAAVMTSPSATNWIKTSRRRAPTVT